MEDFSDLKFVPYGLQNRQNLKLSKTGASEYTKDTQALFFKSSILRNLVPNQYKNISNLDVLKRQI